MRRCEGCEEVSGGVRGVRGVRRCQEVSGGVRGVRRCEEVSGVRFGELVPDSPLQILLVLLIFSALHGQICIYHGSS